MIFGYFSNKILSCKKKGHSVRSAASAAVKKLGVSSTEIIRLQTGQELQSS